MSTSLNSDEIRTVQYTTDGSHTLYVPALDECYHSSHGAIQESMHVFIQTAFRQKTEKNLTILEVGFGTGLNALLTAHEAAKTQQHVRYVALEKYPVSLELAMKLNYSECLGDKSPLFVQLHAARWHEATVLSPCFTLMKHDFDFTEYKPGERFDLIYFDAFSPDKQAEMWTPELFALLYKACRKGAILATYCAKGSVRRALQSAGFVVERLPGPPGKREILRARKP